MEDALLLTIYKQPHTVFTLKELSLLRPHISYPNLKRRIHYLVQTNKLRRLRKGVYGKDNYSILEAANKIYTPSYISLETVLQKEGVIFQHYTTTFIISYLSRQISVNGHDFFYRKIGSGILLNRLGIVEKDGYFIASRERAFLDAIFLYKDYHFDNLKPLRWEKIDEIKHIYKNASFNKRVEQYQKLYQTDYAGQK